MKASLCFIASSLLILITTCKLAQASNSCGGSLLSNEGSLEYKDEDYGGRRTTCVWVIRLLSKYEFEVTLNNINYGNYIHIFATENQERCTSGITQPDIRFNSTSVGTTHTAPGSVLVVVLRPASWHQREFKFTWKGVWNNYYTHLESVNYLDTENGEINESDGGASAFAYILNPTKADSSGNHLALNVELGIAGYELNCAALSYFIYDINEDGNLYEIARTCGRPVSLRNLQPPLIALVVKETYGQTEFVHLKWDSVYSYIPTITPSYEPTYAPTDYPGTTSPPEEVPDYVESINQCGGILVGKTGVINYRLGNPYKNDERCIWTIRSACGSKIRLQLLTDGFENCCDFLTVSTIPDLSYQATVQTVATIKTGNTYAIEVDGPIVFLAFRSDHSVIGTGFLLHFSSELESTTTEQPEYSTTSFPLVSYPCIYSYRHFHLNSSVIGSWNYFSFPTVGNYGNNQVATVVLNPPFQNPAYNLQFYLQYTSIEESTNCIWDVLTVQAYEYQGTVVYRDRLCRWNFDVNRYYSSHEGGLILVFKSDFTVNGAGFQGYWSYGLEGGDDTTEIYPFLLNSNKAAERLLNLTQPSRTV